MARLIAIPDIHGRNDLFGALMNWLQLGRAPSWDPLAWDDKIVLMGDYIDRGFDSKGVIERIRYLQAARRNTVALRGNHEMFAVDSFMPSLGGPIGDHSARTTYDCWMRPNNGGAMTMASYQGTIPLDVLEWITSLPISHEEDGFFFSHAPAPRDNRRPVHLREQPFTMEELIWGCDRDEPGYARDFKDRIGVCGHVHKLQDWVLTPRFYPHYIYTDAGCGCHPKAPLVAVDVKARTYMSVAAGKHGDYEIGVFNEEHVAI